MSSSAQSTLTEGTQENSTSTTTTTRTRPRSTSQTRQLFSQCALIEIIHLHDCLRGALQEIRNDVGILVQNASCIDDGKVGNSRMSSSKTMTTTATTRNAGDGSKNNRSTSAETSNSGAQTPAVNSASLSKTTSSSSSSSSSTSLTPSIPTQNSALSTTVATSAATTVSSKENKTTRSGTDKTATSTSICTSATPQTTIDKQEQEQAGQNPKKKIKFEVDLASNLSGKVASRFHLIWSVFQAHSGAEDEFIWPALKMKLARNRQRSQQTNNNTNNNNSANGGDDTCITTPSCGCESAIEQEEYEEDHAKEESMFKQIHSTLRRLKGSFRYYDVNGKGQQAAQALYIIKQVILLLKKQTDSLTNHLEIHLRKEETQCLPMVQKHLTNEEISSLVGNIMGKRSAEVMTKILNLALCSLPEDERADMVSHMKKAMIGTFFERWLTMGGWTSTLGASGGNESGSGSPLLKPAKSGSNNNLRALSSKRPLNMSGTDGGAQKKKKSMRDSTSTSGNARLRHPSKYYQADEDGNVSLVWDMSDSKFKASDTEDVPLFTQPELTPTFHFSDTQGGPVFGCDHYSRACKLRHPETGQLFTCRLCCEVDREKNRYDDDSLPVLDRNAVSEVLCMRCGTLQPAGSKCINPSCEYSKKPFAKYSCEICNLYDDHPKKSIYHCPYCNVCRKGKGLGIDFRHCMRCNACVAISEYDDHVCIPQRLQGNCVICHENLFESTAQLRGLPCGHVLHLSCFNDYVSRAYSGVIKCPLCNKEFDNMRG